ncbi:MAG TPA: hypothetical protein VK625_00110 [Flavitalea sp.]|nr:hypothetical protein [Flavitalea sp.]
MNTTSSVRNLIRYLKTVNWKLLIFLVLILNVKLIFKVIALMLVYVIQADFRPGFKLNNSRLPLFYPAMIAIAVFNWIISKSYYDTNKNLLLITGIFFWIACMLIVHQLKYFVETTTVNILHNTLTVFFVINAILSVATIFGIIVETGSINPYRFQGNYQKYFINTGDYIKGISFDTSITNAAINVFGIYYFLFERNFKLVFLCMTVLLLSASNLSIFILFTLLLLVFIFKSDKAQKSVIAICFFMLVVFFGRISPQNNQYVSEIFKGPGKSLNGTVNVLSGLSLQQTPDILLNVEEKKEKIALNYLDKMSEIINDRIRKQEHNEIAAVSLERPRPVIPTDDIHSRPFQRINDTNELRSKLLSYIKNEHIAPRPVNSGPGKLLAAKQIIYFLKQHPDKIISGNGTGNFSSKLALRATSLGFAGGYPKEFAYTHPDFKENHLAVYLSFFSDQAKLHSVLNSPNSVYFQLIGEYGLAGILSFIFLYIWFFLRHRNDSGFVFPMLLILLFYFSFDYWFEQLSIVPIFELLIFINRKKYALEGE